jgi:hypothetical protein
VAIAQQHYSAFDRTDLSGFDRTTTVCKQRMACEEEFLGGPVKCTRCNLLILLPRRSDKTALYSHQLGIFWPIPPPSNDATPPPPA